MNDTRKRVAVLFGGRSVEHEISIITALQLIAAIDTARFEVRPVYIAHSGRWYTGNGLLDRSFYRGLPAALDSVEEVTLLPIPGLGGLSRRRSSGGLLQRLSGKSDEILPVDLYLPAFHGQHGEDGCLQGLFEMADVPYTGSDVASSAVAMNKYLCKLVAQSLGISTLPAALVHKSTALADLEGTCRAVTETAGLTSYPLFVKPCHLGSSIGIGRAGDLQELKAALANVFRYDLQAIVEPQVIDLMEINVSVMDGDPPFASVVEIPVSKSGVLSYEEKYMRGGSAKKGKGASTSSTSEGMASLTRVINPTDLDPPIKEQVQRSALALFNALGSGGLGRFDFIYDTKSAKLYFNELNPIPGSFSFYLWEKSLPPLVYTEVINRIIERGLERRQRFAGLERDTGFKAMFKA